jgi:hypothetical protein
MDVVTPAVRGLLAAAAPVNTGRMAAHGGPTVGRRELRIPLQASAPLPRRPAGVVAWSSAVGDSAQPCVLMSTDGVLIVASEPAARMLGPSARPGVGVETWWHELSLHAGDAPSRASMLGRAIAIGSPAHSVLVLDLPDGPTTVQVMAAPLHAGEGRVSALLAFFWPMSSSATAVPVP